MTIYGHIPEISVFELTFNVQTIGNHMHSLYRQNMRNLNTNRIEFIFHSYKEVSKAHEMSHSRAKIEIFWCRRGSWDILADIFIKKNFTVFFLFSEILL